MVCVIWYHCIVWILTKSGIFSGPYFAAFVFLRIQFEWGNIPNRKNSVFEDFSCSVYNFKNVKNTLGKRKDFHIIGTFNSFLANVPRGDPGLLQHLRWSALFITKRSILDVAETLDPRLVPIRKPLGLSRKLSMQLPFFVFGFIRKPSHLLVLKVSCLVSLLSVNIVLKWVTIC